jgi:acyl-CoA dehydrogenase
MLNRMGVTELAGTEQYAELREAYRAFMDTHVYAAEPALAREDEAADALISELRARAKTEGLWAPHLPPEAGGTGHGFLAYAHLNEEIGRSFWAQLVFNCQAPDAGNGEILHLFGTEEQKEQFLRPLVEGTTRSFFSMTEPEVSGADPTGLRTTAVLDGGEWVIDGAVQVHGGLGLTDRTPLAAMLAMARGARIYDGPDEVHRMVVSRRILKAFEEGKPWRFE